MGVLKLVLRRDLLPGKVLRQENLVWLEEDLLFRALAGPPPTRAVRRENCDPKLGAPGNTGRGCWTPTATYGVSGIPGPALPSGGVGLCFGGVETFWG